MTPNGTINPIEQTLLLTKSAPTLIHTHTSIQYNKIIVDENKTPTHYNFIDVIEEIRCLVGCYRIGF
jgi:hypothetical protein